jgi:hypothetical protein
MTNIKGENGGAAEFGSYVWGSPAQQHSVSPETNIIAVANDPVAYKGGMKSNTGGDLTTLAVPAVLANHLYNPKRNSFRKEKGKGRDRNVSKIFKGGETGTETGEMNNLLKKSDNLMNMITPTTMPSVVYNTTNMTPPEPNNVPVYTGGNIIEGNIIEGNIKQTGAGILTDIAVPAVLLTANHLYGRSKKYGKTEKTEKTRKTRKTRKTIKNKNKRSRRVSFNKK